MKSETKKIWIWGAVMAMFIWGLVLIAVCSDDRQAVYNTKKAAELERRIDALAEEVRKERIYMEHKFEAVDDTIVAHWRRYEQLHKEAGKKESEKLHKEGVKNEGIWPW